MDINILFEDEYVIACDKPSGLLSEGESKDSLPTLLADQGLKVFCVHRLDRETSGIIIYAKTSAAAASLSAQIQGGEFQKEYLALIEGAPAEPEGSFEDMLFYDRAKNKSFVVKDNGKARKGVKRALLDYRLISSEGGRSLVRVRLHTGRTHQIRVQFASRKMPLVADRRYGARPTEEKTFSLRCCYVSFIHPNTHKRIEINC